MAKRVEPVELDPVTVEIGNRLRAAMRAKKLTGRDLEKALKMSSSGVSDMLKGKTTKQYRKLLEVCRLLGVAPNVILGWDPDADADVSIIESAAAAFEQVLVVNGWDLEGARELVGIVLDAAREPQIEGVDRRLAARALAASRARLLRDK